MVRRGLPADGLMPIEGRRSAPACRSLSRISRRSDSALIGLSVNVARNKRRCVSASSIGRAYLR